MNCNLTKYKTLQHNKLNKDEWVPIDWKKIQQESRILRLNMLLGNTKPCRCSECNIDTGN